MKRFQATVSIGLIICLLFTLVACGKTPADPTVPPTEPSTAPLPEQQVLINTEGMTDLQKAVVITAESYYLRGRYMQYSQGRRTPGVKAPEDYTSQYAGYTDCSAFVHDVYRFALGVDISGGSPLTENYCKAPFCPVLYEQPVKDKFSSMPVYELAAKTKEFLECIQPGDIVVYRNAANTSGHAMLYVGNNMMIHSTGSDSATEENGTCRYDSIINAFFSKSDSRYLFNKSVYVILRPIKAFTGEIPAPTQQRMDLMRGVVAEKLCTHTWGQHVRPGETMTFTFRIQNRSNLEKTLTVTDTVPANTTYISGAQTVNGAKLSWTVTVPAGGSAEVSYSVRVDPTAPVGQYIYSSSEISGIAVNCPVVQILNGK